jgi:glutamyl-tRNA reductase
VTLLAVGLSYRTAALALRERVELADSQAAELLASLVQQEEVDEAAALSTCNRTELYIVATDAEAAAAAATTALARVARLPGPELTRALFALHGTEAARHVFRVAAGLDSMVLGEAEIQGQVRRSYELALSLGTSGPIVNRLLQDALRAGKRVRSETAISRRGVSVASVAVELARRELGDLAGARALLIGAGKHGALTARALTAAGAQTVFLANRGWDRATDLARRFGGRVVGFDQLAAELSRADLVLTCTSCPYRILSAAELAAAAAGRRIVVVDTAVPRDVEPEARRIAEVTLYDLDDIERMVTRNVAGRAAEAQLAEPIVDDEVARFGRWLASLDVVPTITALHERGLAAAERAVRGNERHWCALSDADRERVELMARAVVTDLLHEPMVRLRRAGERGLSSVYLETVRELFGLEAASGSDSPLAGGTTTIAAPSTRTAR